MTASGSKADDLRLTKSRQLHSTERTIAEASLSIGVAPKAEVTRAAARRSHNSRHPLSDDTLLLFGWSTTVIFEALRNAMVMNYPSGEISNHR